MGEYKKIVINEAEYASTYCDEKPTQGSKKDEGKSRVDLLPVDALMAVGEVMHFGCKKYAPNNWRIGIPLSKLTASSLRHDFKFRSNLHSDLDEESGIHHLAHKIANDLMALQLLLEGRDELDDRYKR